MLISSGLTMPIDEAQSYTDLLTLLWNPQNPSAYEGHDELIDWADYLYEATITEGVYLKVELNEPFGDIPDKYILFCEETTLYAYHRDGICCFDIQTEPQLVLHNKDGHHKVHQDPQLQEKERRIIERWWPLFRRNCYLFGWPVEATPKEKAEWDLWYEQQQMKTEPPCPTQFCLWNEEEILEAQRSTQGKWQKAFASSHFFFMPSPERPHTH